MSWTNYSYLSLNFRAELPTNDITGFTIKVGNVGIFHSDMGVTYDNKTEQNIGSVPIRNNFPD